MSTSELASDLRRDVEHYRGLWRTARSADAKVRNAAQRKKAKTKAMASWDHGGRQGNAAIKRSP